MAQRIELNKSVPVIADVDVLVVGAGIAGSTAAVTAARNGARTMVVDRFGYPGGNMGPGMIGGAPNLELPEAMAEGLPVIPRVPRENSCAAARRTATRRSSVTTFGTRGSSHTSGSR